MTLPLILVVDDQFARDSSERLLFLRRTGLCEETARSKGDSLAEAVFCSGQRITSDGRVVNDFSIVADAIDARGWTAWALILLDMRFDSGALGPDGEPAGNLGDDDFGERLRARIAVRYPDLPVVILTSKRHSELDQQQAPYLAKDGLDQMGMASTVVRHARLESDQLSALLQTGPDIIAHSPVSLRALSLAWMAAGGSHSVLLSGETGVGKETIAQYIHKVSGRRGKFMRLSLSPTMSPGDLSAAEGEGGLLESVEGGSLYLDGIDEIGPQLQLTLLRLLEDCDAFPAQAERRAAKNIRILASSAVTLRDSVASGAFRQDLYFRVAAQTIDVPPLRQRAEDVPAMAEAFLNQISTARGRPNSCLGNDGAQRLAAYAFPGNIRELRHLMERLSTSVGPHQIITAADIDQILPETLSVSRALTAQSSRIGEARDAGSFGPLSRQDLATAFTGANDAHGEQLLYLVELALDETRHQGKTRSSDLDDLNPTQAMKLLLGRTSLTTGQAADEIKRVAALVGSPPAGSDFARVVQWALRLRGGGTKRHGSGMAHAAGAAAPAGEK